MKKILFLLLVMIIVACNKVPNCDTIVADTTVTAYYNQPVEGMDSVIARIKYEDSIYYTCYIDSILRGYEDASVMRDKMFENRIDSVKIINDSLRVELFKAQYKLNKISEYNAIAAKGNNIKYLRGWIRRALEE